MAAQERYRDGVTPSETKSARQFRTLIKLRCPRRCHYQGYLTSSASEQMDAKLPCMFNDFIVFIDVDT